MKDKRKIKLIWEIFITFFKIGSFAFGGGYAMIPLIEQEVIKNKSWITKEEIVDVFAISQTMPGAIAINSSTFIGYKIAGGVGSIFATLGVILPSYMTIVVIAAFFSRIQNNPIVQAIFSGVKPAIVGLIVIAAIKIGKSSIKDGLGLLITLISVILVVVLEINAIYVIIGGAVAGLLICKIYPQKGIKFNTDEGDRPDLS